MPMTVGCCYSRFIRALCPLDKETLFIVCAATLRPVALLTVLCGALNRVVVIAFGNDVVIRIAFMM